MSTDSGTNSTAESVSIVSQLLEELVLHVPGSPWDITASPPPALEPCPSAHKQLIDVIHQRGSTVKSTAAGDSTEPAEVSETDANCVDTERTTDASESLVLRHVPASVSSGCSIVHLRVNHQFEKMTCGHHAMYNVLCLATAVGHHPDECRCAVGKGSTSEDSANVDCVSSVAESVEGRLAELQSMHGLWRRYWHTVRRLVSRCEELGGDTWPWDSQTVKAGLVERTYLRYLLQEDSALRGVQTFCPMVEVQFGYDHFLNSLDQVHTLHREITDFARAGTHRCLGFFLGVLDHWVSAVAVKAPYEDSVPVGDANSENGQQYKVMLVYMDSKNNDILSKNYDELLAHAAKRQEESEKRKGKPWTPREREQCVQFFEDAGKLVHSLSWCLEGRSNMLTQYLAFSVDYIIDSFICHVTPRAAAKCEGIPHHLKLHLEQSKQENGDKSDADLGAEEDDLFLVYLLSWLETYHRPADIHHTLVDAIRSLGVEHLDDTHRQRLLDWARDLKDRESFLLMCGLPLVEKVVDVINDLLALLLPKALDSRL